MRTRCFVAMPFRKDLNFFYLYLRRHLEERHDIEVFRGDSKILTVPILDKIVADIAAADLVVADLTGRNANVFFELGIAYAAKKPTILLAQEEAEEIPVDVRPFEYIRYDLGDDIKFLSQIDKALAGLFEHRYQALYEKALPELKKFRKISGIAAPAVDLAEFRRRLVRDERAAGLPDAGSAANLMRFLLPRLLDSNDIDLLQKLNSWLEQHFPQG